MDMHTKMAFHFASFVVSLIGLKFGYKIRKKYENRKRNSISFGGSV